MKKNISLGINFANSIIVYFSIFAKHKGKKE